MSEPMKFVPRPSGPLPERPAPSTTTTTRFLRLRPAPDIPPAAAKPAAEAPPVPAPIPPAPEPLAPNPDDSIFPTPVSTASIQATSTPDPAESIFPEPTPVSLESLQATSAPEPAEPIFPRPAPETESQQLRYYSIPEPATASPVQPPDDRPMRYTTKRLPNVFAAAPSARWSASAAAGSQSLRRIPAAEISGSPAPPAPAVPAESPAPAEEIQSEVMPDPIPERAPEQITALPEPPAPPEWPDEPAPAPISFSPQVPPVPQVPASTPDTPFTGPRLGAPRFTPAPVPLSRLTAGEPRPLGRGFWILLVILAIGLVLLLYFFGLTPRIAAGQELDHEQKLSTERIVAYGVARLATPQVELPLPGTIEAFQQASLYARTNGYVKRWLVDIGDQVKEGQLLAELDTPEVDQQLTQARAAADQAKASLNIAQSAAQRWNTMASAHAVSQEDADEKNATNNEAQANFNAAQANVARLVDLENFKEIRAPFPGKITYRNIDVGSLVTAGTGTASGELFRVAQTDPLRVFIDVPEANAPAIKPGVPANIQVTSYPGRVFHGEVVRDAGALSNASRTLRTEVRVANPDGALLPGAFAEVRLQLLDSTPAVLIPAAALIVNATGTSVALLQDTYGRDVVHYTSVRVGRDFGTEVEILENVRQGDRLVTNPPADMNDGTAVTARPVDKAPLPSPLPPHPVSPRA